MRIAARDAQQDPLIAAAACLRIRMPASRSYASIIDVMPINLMVPGIGIATVLKRL
jgi:hypothetical protein